MTASTIWAFDSRNLGFSVLRPDGTIYNFTKSTVSQPVWDEPPAALTADYVLPLPRFTRTCQQLLYTYCLQLAGKFAGMDGNAVAIHSLDNNNAPIEQVDLYPIYYTMPNPSRTSMVTPR